MKHCLRSVVSLCFFVAFLIRLSAQTPEAEIPELKRLDSAYQVEQHDKLDAPREAAVKRLNESYRVTVETASKKAALAGQLDETLALRAEAKRFADDQTVPETDGPDTIPNVVKFRAAWRNEIARLGKVRSTAAGPLAEAQLARLRQLEKDLTRTLKIDEAKVVRARVDAFVAQLPAPPLVAAATSLPGSTPVPRSTPAPRGIAMATPRQLWTSAMAKTAWQQWIGKTIRIRTSRPGPEYLQVADQLVKALPLDPANPEASLFVVSKGQEPETISLEPQSQPGTFLRHQGYVLKVSKGTNKDSNFTIVRPKRGEEGYSLSTANFPTHNFYVNERDGVGLSPKIPDPLTAVFFFELAPPK